MDPVVPSENETVGHDDLGPTVVPAALAPQLALDKADILDGAVCDAGAPIDCMTNDQYVAGSRFEPTTEFEVLFQYDPVQAVADARAEPELFSSPGVMGPDMDMRTGAVDYDLQLANLILESGLFNFQGLRVPLNTHWNTDLLSQLLQNYADRQVCDFIKYGWPVDRDPEMQLPRFTGRNHRGATEFPGDIDEFVSQELQAGRLMGPYDYPGFNAEWGISPINSVPKRSSNQRRIILDLSWNKCGPSINEGVDKDWFLGEYKALRYPTVNTFVKRIKSLGPGCLMYKKDLSKAFFQIPLCPSCYRFMGFFWRGKYYFSKVMVMGLSTGCRACQRMTSCLRYIHGEMGYYLCNFIDDMVGAEFPEIAQRAYEALGRTIRDLGLVESEDKQVPPTTQMEFLGNLLNSVDMTISVTPDRILELQNELQTWLHTQTITRRALESIIGKLQFVCNCVRSGRLFLNRLLNFLRGTRTGQYYVLPSEAKKDLVWWNTYLPLFPATSLMFNEDFLVPDMVVASDSCLEAAGGVCGSQYFRSKFPAHIKAVFQDCIAGYEMWGIILSLKIWGAELRGKKVVFHCDNEAVATLLNTGRARDSRLQQGLREICFIAAINEFEILGKFIPGCDNRKPDLLSRWWKGEKYRQEFRRIASGFTRRSVRNSLFYYSHDW